MDKYDVIDATTDLSKLEDDYFNWCTLPFKRRMRANDNCMSMHGCTVPQYYDRLRDAIVKADVNTTPNNVETVSEDVYLTPDSMEKDMELFSQIQKIKENPYIVLITPDINTLESLTKEYNRFLDLIPKNKRISNEYSLQLFGLDVYNMYSKMLAKITNGDYCINNSDNIDRYNSEILSEEGNIIACKESTEAVYESALLRGDLLSAYIVKAKTNFSLLDEGLNRSAINYEPKYYKLTDLNTDILSGASLPFFTRSELDRFNSSYVSGGRVYMRDDYYKKLKDNINLYYKDRYTEYEDKLIGLGWNPALPYNKESIILAKNRWVDYFNESGANCIDLNRFMNAPTNYTQEDEDIKGRTACKPIYIILGFDKDSIEYTYNPYKYDKLAISFCSSNIKDGECFIMDGNFREQFNGFKQQKGLPGFKFIYIISLYLDLETRLALYNNIRNMENPIDIVKSYVGGSIFNLVSRTTNEYSPDNAKIFYSHLCDFIYRLVSIDINNGDIDSKYKLNFNAPNIFKVYSGKYADYTDLESNRIDQIHAIINNETNRSTFVKDLMNQYNIPDTIPVEKEMSVLLTPSAIIKTKDS